MTKYLIAATILILSTVLVTDHIKKDKARDLKYLQEQNELEQQLEQTRSELQRQAGYRDSLVRYTDSVSLLVGGLTAYNLKLGKELAKIKGRYKNVPVDSLGLIMENRANASRRRTN